VADAKKERFGAAEALRMAHAAAEVYVAKGKKVVHFDLKRDAPSDAELLRHLLGPSGNLRAPALRAGTMLFVGFEPETFGRLL
jgi:hypothetical protein